MTSEEEMAFKGRCLGDYLDEYNLTFRDVRQSFSLCRCLTLIAPCLVPGKLVGHGAGGQRRSRSH